MTSFRKRVCGVVLTTLFGSMPILAALSTVAGQTPELQFATPTDETSDQFAVPNTDDVGELMNFVQSLQQHLQQNQPRSAAELAPYRQKLESLKGAAERILQLEKNKSSEPYQAAEGILLQFRIGEVVRAPVAEQRKFVEEIASRLESDSENSAFLGVAGTLAQVLERAGNTEIAARANQRFGEVLSKQEDARLSSIGKMMLATARRLEILKAPVAEQRSFIEEIAKSLEDEPGDLSKPAEAQSLAQFFERSGNMELAVLANKRFGEMLAKQDDPRLSRLGKGMEGVARRLGLVGSEMELAGTTVDGKPFDWKAYRGRVVLVDFWATWCGPCLAELPNVRKNYQLYHDRGFDVVGISLDQDREALEQFIENDPLPWTTLYEEGGQHPAASYYGITGIPTVILVDRDGKVVSLQARGPQLGQLLERLLGPAEAGSSASSPADAPG